jgi:hypothetical protein
MPQLPEAGNGSLKIRRSNFDCCVRVSLHRSARTPKTEVFMTNDQEARERIRKLFKTPPRIGRPSELTAKAVKTILKSLEVGLTFEQAARRGGISRQTFYTWRTRGKRDRDAKIESVYSVFLDALEDALAEAEAKMLKSIFDSGAKGAMWLLPRRYPQRYGDRLLIDRAVNDELEQLMEVLDQVLPDDLLTKITDRMKELYPDFKAHDMGDFDAW